MAHCLKSQSSGECMIRATKVKDIHNAVRWRIQGLS